MTNYLSCFKELKDSFNFLLLGMGVAFVGGLMIGMTIVLVFNLTPLISIIPIGVGGFMCVMAINEWPKRLFKVEDIPIMAELTDREKKIVCINFIMHSPEFKQVPIDLREQMLMLAIKIRGMKYDKDEMLDLGAALVAERDMILKTQIGWLQKHKDSVKGLSGIDL